MSELPVIVGIGASAGGLEALQSFFEALSPDSGAAFVVVQHLSPDFRSLMDEILQRHTKLRLTRVDEAVTLEPNRVFLIAPRTDLQIDGTQLVPKPQSADKPVQNPINVLFHSMADNCAGRCVAIVMSGTGTDGAHGLRAVKESGGVVMVQEPDTAAFDGMPRAAIATGVVDFTLAPPHLAARGVEVVKLQQKPGGAHLTDEEVETDGPAFARILSLLEQQTSLRSSAYKIGTVARRAMRRMVLLHVDSMDAYVRILERDADECRALARDCMIHVTRFFRDEDAFNSLRRLITARFLPEAGGERPLRAWIVGCSTGEEAYSVAIMLDQLARERGCNLDYKIFASDLDQDAIETASRGRFGIGAIDDIQDDGARLYFEPIDGAMQINGRLRNRMVFARHDVLVDPPFPRVDLVLCRNLLIYLRPDAQRRVFERLHYSLVKGGVMVLGPSEAVDFEDSGFGELDSRWKIFERVDQQRPMRDPAVRQARIGSSFRDLDLRRYSGQRVDQNVLGLQRACEVLVANFAICGLIADEFGTLVYSFGDVARFLSVPNGRMNSSLAAMLPPDDAAAIQLAMRQGRASDAPVRVPNVHLGEQRAPVDTVFVSGQGEGPDLHVLLVGSGTTEVVLGGETVELDADEVVRRQVEVLEQDLAHTRTSLQTTIEELETTNEEMQSVNEELFSSNEELQSTNEELHSVNEELYTVNAEHKHKIEQLAEVSVDLQNFLMATRFGVLFVDQVLNVRRFTPDISILLPLQESDLGRPLGELRSRIGPDLVAISRDVIKSGEAWERRLVTEGGQPVLVAVRPYMSSQSQREGCVITCVDLRGMELVGDSPVRVATVAYGLDALREGVFWIRDIKTGRYHFISGGFEGLWGASVRECLEDPAVWWNRVQSADRVRLRDGDALLTREHRAERYRIEAADGSTRWIEDLVHGTVRAGNGEELISGLAIDRTELIEGENQLRQRSEQLAEVVDELDVAVLLAERTGEIRWANEAATAAFAKADGQVPTNLLRCFEGDDQWSELSTAFAELTGGAKFELQGALPAANSAMCRFTVVGEAASELILCRWSTDLEVVGRQADLVQRNTRLEHEATTDPLTGLRNRRGLQSALSEEVALCKRSDDAISVLLIDCDRFKEINEAYDHSAGDLVLKEVAQRLAAQIRPSDVVARIGGDEFMVVLPGTRTAEGAHVGEKLRRAVAGAPIQLKGSRIQVTVSVGVANLHPESDDVEELISLASQVLRESKVRGRNRVMCADRERPEDDRLGDPAVPELLASAGLWMATQTIHRVADGEVAGREYLARSQQPGFGPKEFFSLAWNASHLLDVDLECFAAAVKRIGQDEPSPREHLNLMPSTLLNDSGRRLDALLDRIEDPSRVCIELSEQQFVGSTADLRVRLRELRDRGLAIALDDVGFGRSALESLLVIEPEVIKIDPHLIQRVDTDETAVRALQRMHSMLEGLGADVIAEGVEREGQRAVLAEIGVPLGQGRLWSTPAEV